MGGILDLAPYWMVIVLMMTGLYVLMAKENLLKKVLGLNVFQSAVILFYVLLGKVRGGTAPILTGEDFARAQRGEELANAYSNPVPHVLMLTAIVVGIAITALALALVARIHEAYDTIEESDVYGQEEEP